MHIKIATRGLLILAVAAMFLCSASQKPAYAVSDEDFKKLMQKVEELSQQNKVLTEKVKSLEKKGVKGSPAQITEINERVKALETKDTDKEVAEIKENVSDLTTLMSNVERKALLDRVQFSAEMRTRCDWFDYNARVPKTTGLFGLRKNGYTRENDSVQAVFSNRFRLNMKTELTDNVRFSGRLTMFKRWNQMEGITVRATNEGRVPDDEADLVVERAYVDYFFEPHPKLPMALTFGRLPISEGLPSDLKEDTQRKSVYPALAWDVTGDGAGLTFMLDSLTGLNESAFRLVYYRSNRDSTDLWYRHNELQDDLEVFFAQYETKLPGKYLQDIFFVFNFLYLPEFPSIDLTSSSVLRAYDVPKDFGKTWKLTFLAEAKQYLGSNFDWFVSLSHSDARSYDLNQYRVFGIIPGPSIGFVSPGNENQNGNGYCIFLGTRYTIPWELMKNPKLGIEYNYGSKYWTNTNQASEDPLRKLNTRGYAWDFYYIQPINKVLSARLGYTWIRNEHPDLGGEDIRYMQRITNTYLLLDAKF